MTKAERIRKLAEQHPEWSTKQIAAKCDCLPEYVRVVLRQRVDGGTSAADLRWRAANPERLRAILRGCGERYREKNRERVNANWRARYHRKKAERQASAPA